MNMAFGWGRDLRRNLRAGLRLMTLRRVALLDFRCNLPQLGLLLVLGVGLRLFDEARSAGFEVSWVAEGWLQEGFYTALVLAVAGLLAHFLRQPHLPLALPCVLLSGAPFYEVVGWIERPLLEWTAAHWPPGETLLGVLSALWLLVWLWRSVAVSLHPQRPHFWWRANAGAALLAGALILPSSLFAPAQLLVPAALSTGPAAGKGWVFSEEALAAQMQLLVQSLDAIEEERPDRSDIFFVGFAPFAGAEVFRRDLALARAVIEERYDASAHSVAMLNNPGTALDEPWATVSNLQLALSAVGAAMNPEEDVLFLYLTSHGSEDQQLEADLPPLQLQPLTPTALARQLDEAQIKWRVIVVSACYSGGFIPPLRNANTVIVTAARSDRTSFGCEDKSDLTYFGEALFSRALREEGGLIAAFERAKALVTAREQAEKLIPSEPQIFVGEAMRVKLAQLESEAPRRRSGMMAARGAASGGL